MTSSTAGRPRSPRRARSTAFVVAALIAIAMLGTTAACSLFGIGDDGFDLPIKVEHTFDINLDLSALPTSGQTAPERLEIPLNQPPLALPAIPVDLTNQQEIYDNKDKLKSVEISQITIRPTANSVTADLPAIDLYVGPAGATDISNAIKVATIPSIPAGSTTTIGGEIDDAGMASAQQHITTLNFTFIPDATLVVEAGETVPGGAADLNITLAITATVDPTK